MDSRPAKYYLAKKRGATAREAAVQAGYGNTPSTQIEESKVYQAIERHYRDEILGKLSLSNLADEHIKVIVQDKDLGAKNKAIEMALNRVEPDTPQAEESDRVLVILADSAQSLPPSVA